MKQHLALAAVLLAAVAATGCSSTGTKDLPAPPSTAGAGDSSISTAGTNTNGAGNGSAIGSGAGVNPAYDLTNKTVYFAYDSSDIDSAGHDVVNNFGRYLTGKPTAKVRLEGHTDERGSAEYNVALGERRAQAVQRELRSAGVGEGQISVISYGKERPAVQGHDEAAYSKNRRVEITQQ